jgi:hypothetical protein
VATNNGKNGTLRRAKMAAAALGLNLTAMSTRCGCTLPHLRGVLLGERVPSERLSEAMKGAFGRTWPFVRGQVDVLTVQPPEVT